MADSTYTPTVNFTGIASGIDFNAMIDAYLKVEGRYKDQLEQRKEDYENRIQLAQELNSLILDLKNTVEGMDTPEEFIERNAVSSNETVLTATATSEATPGTHTIVVGSSVSQRLASQGWNSSTSSIGGSSGDTFTLDVGGHIISITLSDANGNGFIDMKDLVYLINSSSQNDEDGDGNPDYVYAEIINDGSSSNPYRLVFNAVQGGSSNTIKVTANTTSLNWSTPEFDSVELTSWSGTATVSVTSTATYTGDVNKTFYFKVVQGGTLGTDTIIISWEDPVEGKSGTISVTGAGTYDVYQGLQLDFASDGDTINTGDTFKVDVFYPTLQKGQDTGLAQADKEVHSGFSDPDTTPVTNTNGTFSYTYAGITYTINVPAGSTLEDLARLINNAPDNPGVSATIVNDGLGTTTSYHLVLTGQPGAANEIKNITYTLDNFEGTFTEVQDAQNAMLKVDGFPKEVNDPSDTADSNGVVVKLSSAYQYMQNPSNTVSDVITGVTLYLKASGSVNLTVETDTDAMRKKIEDFVDAYNKVIDKIEELTYFDPTGKNTGPFIGNYALLMVEDRLMRAISTSLPGFKEGVDRYTSLSQVGIKTGEGKKLKIDKATLDEALSKYPEEVAKLFSANMEPYVYVSDVSNGTNISYYSRFPDTKPGFYEVTINPSTNDGSFRYKRTWYDAYSEARTYSPLDDDGTYYYLTGMDSNYPEYGLTVRTSDRTTDGQTAEVRLLKGVFGELSSILDFITDASTGPINVMVDHYNEVVQDLDEQIQREEYRLSVIEKMLRDKFARLEGFLQEMQGQSDYLAAMASNMAASSLTSTGTNSGG